MVHQAPAEVMLLGSGANSDKSEGTGHKFSFLEVQIPGYCEAATLFPS